MNAIHDLLDEVTRTGQRPADEQISAVVTRGASVRERQEARRQIRIAAKKIVAVLDSETPGQAAQLAEDASEALAQFTTGSDAAPTGRDLADQVPRHQPHAPQPRAARTAAGEPLRELFGSRVRTGATAADLDSLALRSDVSAAERSEWRKQVLADSRTIAATWRTGAQAAARRLAVEYAEKHAGMLDAPSNRDPNEHVDDPHELGALVPRGALG